MAEVCQRSGTLDLDVFYRLPRWMQLRHLGHQANLVMDAYRHGATRDRAEQERETLDAVAEDRRRRGFADPSAAAKEA